ELLDAREVRRQRIADHADVLEALEVQVFLRAEELLGLLLALRVAAEVIAGPLLLRDQLLDAPPRLFLGGARNRLVALRAQEALGDAGEARQGQLLARLGEEELAVGAEHA